MKCQKCHKRKGKHNYASDGMMGFTHGMYELVCTQCLIKIMEGNKKNIEKGIKELKGENVNQELFHVADVKNLDSILSQGLNKNSQGIVNLTKNPYKWKKLHDNPIIFKVRVPLNTQLKEHHSNDVYCLNSISNKNIIVYDYLSKEKNKVKRKVPSLKECVDENVGRRVPEYKKYYKNKIQEEENVKTIF